MEENTLTLNDVKILKAICGAGSSEDEDKGIVKAKGTSVNEIMDLADLSRGKISKTLKTFKEEGYVEEGLADGRMKTYVITDKGLETLKEMFGVK